MNAKKKNASVLYNGSYNSTLHSRSSRPFTDPQCSTRLPHAYHAILQSSNGDRTRQYCAASNQLVPTYAGDIEYEGTHAIQNRRQN